MTLIRLGHLKVLKKNFLETLMILVTSSFSLHCYYVYNNFENYYWILHIQYQFIITVRKILLNITQYKSINWINSIS